MNYRMRMLAVHRCQLRNLLSDMSKEQACFLVCSVAQGSDETILLVREVLELSSQDLQIHAPDQLCVAPRAMLRAARRAQALGGSICMVHTHPMCDGLVGFSRADDHGNVRTFEFFQRMLPGQLNSCLVWDGPLQCVSGRVYHSPKNWSPIDGVEVVSGEVRAVHRDGLRGSTQTCEEFDRQARLLGAAGQEKLSGLRLGFVGCGGVGSVAATLSVHAGVRKFTLIDFDTVDKTNLPRIIGSSPKDVQTNALKTDVLERYIKHHAPDATVEIFNAPVEAPELLPHLCGLDAVICGTDDTTSRAFLNQICHQYYIPILDMGVQFGADPTSGLLVKEIGRAHLMLPGDACMCCCGHIDPLRLEFEGLSTIDQQRRRKEGYVVGSDVPEPSMMVFNMQVSAVGLQRLISWVTGLNRHDANSYDSFRFLGLTAEAGIKPIRKRSNPQCPMCGNEAQLLGIGSLSPMLVAPRPSQAVKPGELA